MDANDRTVRLQIFINQKPRVYNTVPKVTIYRYETRWMEGPRVVHCTPYATVHDYPNIYKSWREQTEMNLDGYSDYTSESERGIGLILFLEENIFCSD